jgi:hypothetical protein
MPAWGYRGLRDVAGHEPLAYRLSDGHLVWFQNKEPSRLAAHSFSPAHEPSVEFGTVVSRDPRREVVLGNFLSRGELFKRFYRLTPEVLGGLLCGHPLNRLHAYRPVPARLQHGCTKFAVVGRSDRIRIRMSSTEATQFPSSRRAELTETT